MAKTELENGSTLFFRNPDLNTYGILNVREEFANTHPAYVERVLAAYEQARQWSIQNPAELEAILANAAGLEKNVAAKQIERTDLSNSVIGIVHRDAILAAGNVLKKSGVISASTDVNTVVESLIDPQFIEKVAVK
jgi:sulfonate transport system substrate-binding protein